MALPLKKKEGGMSCDVTHRDNGVSWEDTLRRWNVLPKSLLMLLLSLIAFVYEQPAAFAFKDATEMLMHAVLSQDFVLAGQAMREGADPGATFRDGKSLLMTAVQQKNFAMTQLLIGLGADPHYADNSGHTALHYATDNPNVQILVVLLERSNPNVQCSEGHTPLHRAVQQSNEAAITALLRAGANPLLADAAGTTPMQWAQKKGNGRVMAQFQSVLPGQSRQLSPPSLPPGGYSGPSSSRAPSSGLGAGLQNWRPTLPSTVPPPSINRDPYK
jgi:hypothetical protein